jgi:hypothetical protein
MKKTLLLFVIFLTGQAATVQAQCTVSNLSIEVVNFNTATCQVTFNISFEQEVNSGNKFAYIHLWEASKYHTPASAWPATGNNVVYSSPSKYPEKANLINALATVVVIFNGTANPSIGTTYYPDPAPTGVTPLSSGVTITKTILPGGLMEREEISGLSVTLPNCSGVVTFKGDIWASQAANGKNVHCAIQGLTFSINNPQITAAFKVCNPRSISFGIKNNEPVASITERFIIWKDDGDGVFEPFTGAGGDGPALFTSADTTLAPGGIQSRTQFAYPGSNIPGENASLWLEVIVPSSSYSTVAFIGNAEAGCIPLPVNFKSFNANRNKSNVGLVWETTSETNNKGFAVQRKIGGNQFTTIAFVNSKAEGGNSGYDLIYSFTDNNPVNAVSQYRLEQVDLDGKYKHSEIRSVRGDGQAIKTIVFPNPSSSGHVNVVFEESTSMKDIQLLDMNGRVVSQWKNQINNIKIDNLKPGFYNLRIMDQSTKEQSMEKIIINKY